MAESHLNKGDQVEVITGKDQSSSGPYYPATVLRPPARNKSQIFIEHQSLFASMEVGSDGQHRLREYVDLDNVRPIPPPELRQCFKLGDNVDAYRDSGWYRGTVMDIYENSRYLVLIHDTAQETEFEQFNLRLHREWPDPSRVQSLQEQKKSSEIEVKPRKIRFKTTCGKKILEAKFRIGMVVEVSSDVEGFEGAWFVAKIISTLGADKFLVEYRDLLTEDITELLVEEADACHIRPCPPSVPSTGRYETLQKVDAWHNDGWWEGEIFKVLRGSHYLVYFKRTKEHLIFGHSFLRPHQDWKYGKWSIAEKENSSEYADGVNLKMENSKPVFSKGTKVEVTSDEEGYKGSWYTANIVEILGNDKFLVEYQTLKTDDETEFHKEVAHASNIRPCPPEVQHVHRFALCENVDAWYNDGWWVGYIYQVLPYPNYRVYFTTSKEELEFKHCELRPHQELIAGKWKAGSKACPICMVILSGMCL